MMEPFRAFLSGGFGGYGGGMMSGYGFALPAMILILAWSLVWKGMALWRAARLNQREWFVVLLIVNTVGILEIIYLFFISKDQKEK